MWPVKIRGGMDTVTMNMNQTAKNLYLKCGV
jgi:hypothetical protein